MSSNYQETEVTGTQWKRCGMVQIVNPLDGSARIVFAEEVIMALPNGTKLNVGSDALDEKFRPGTQFPLRNPQTDQLTGQFATHDDVYALLYSLYRHLADVRDGMVIE